MATKARDEPAGTAARFRERRVTALEALRLGRGWTARALVIRAGAWLLAVALAAAGVATLVSSSALVAAPLLALALAVGALAWALTLRRVSVPAVVDLAPRAAGPAPPPPGDPAEEEPGPSRRNP